MLSFFPRDVFDEIRGLIESVSEGFPIYSWNMNVVTTCVRFHCLNQLNMFKQKKNTLF